MEQYESMSINIVMIEIKVAKMKFSLYFVNNVCTQTFKHVSTILVLFESSKFPNYTSVLEKQKITRQNVCIVFQADAFIILGITRLTNIIYFMNSVISVKSFLDAGLIPSAL